MKLQVLLLCGASLAILSLVMLRSRSGPQQRDQQGASTSPDPKPQLVDTSTIFFSLATLCDLLPPLDQSVATLPSGAIELHEDNWRQIEFVASAERASVERELVEVRHFKSANASGTGWKDVYVRKSRPAALHPRGIELSRVLELLRVATPARLFLSTAGTHAEVRGGFAVPLEEGAVLYGYRAGGTIVSLNLEYERAETGPATRTAMETISKAFDLFVVDWYRTATWPQSQPAAGDVQPN